MTTTSQRRIMFACAREFIDMNLYCAFETNEQTNELTICNMSMTHMSTSIKCIDQSTMTDLHNVCHYYMMLVQR